MMPLVFLLLFQQAVDTPYLLGKFEPSSHPDFVAIDTAYWQGISGTYYLRKEAYEAFVAMATAAKKENVHLYLLSATRNFDAQKKIWENKWTGKTLVEGIDLTTIRDKKKRAKMILLYSSMPGTSRHHWGTDMDLCSLENRYFESGEGKKIYEWLQAHAASYGFCQPYTNKQNGRTGYEEEKWHWSYLPLSKKFLTQYERTITEKDITGFAGSETASPLRVVREYVGGVSCR